MWLESVRFKQDVLWDDATSTDFHGLQELKLILKTHLRFILEKKACSLS